MVVGRYPLSMSHLAPRSIAVSIPIPTPPPCTVRAGACSVLSFASSRHNPPFFLFVPPFSFSSRHFPSPSDSEKFRKYLDSPIVSTVAAFALLAELFLADVMVSRFFEVGVGMRGTRRIFSGTHRTPNDEHTTHTNYTYTIHNNIQLHIHTTAYTNTNTINHHAMQSHVAMPLTYLLVHPYGIH